MTSNYIVIIDNFTKDEKNIPPEVLMSNYDIFYEKIKIVDKHGKNFVKGFLCPPRVLTSNNGYFLYKRREKTRQAWGNFAEGDFFVPPGVLTLNYDDFRCKS